MAAAKVKKNAGLPGPAWEASRSGGSWAETATERRPETAAAKAKRSAGLPTPEWEGKMRGGSRTEAAL